MGWSNEKLFATLHLILPSTTTMANKRSARMAEISSVMEKAIEAMQKKQFRVNALLQYTCIGPKEV